MSGGDVVLVVGATGHLGRKVVHALRERGRRVIALVRPGSDASALEGVEVRRGDLLDPASLEAALDGVSSVITTAAGYTRRRKGDGPRTDDEGQRNLADAAKRARVSSFVLTSILRCDDAVDVPHFAAKARTERYLERIGLPFVALRPGAFVDQPSDVWAKSLAKGSLPAIGDASVAWTHVHTRDLAHALAKAVDEPRALGRRIDLGAAPAVSANDVARVASALLDRPIRVKSVPWALAGTASAVIGAFDERARDFRATFRYFLTGKYVADLTAQAELFGPPPSFEDAMRTYLAERSLI